MHDAGRQESTEQRLDTGCQNKERGDRDHGGGGVGWGGGGESVTLTPG